VALSCEDTSDCGGLLWCALFCLWWVALAGALQCSVDAGGSASNCAISGSKSVNDAAIPKLLDIDAFSALLKA
ncbi:MAG: hypothetical protein AAGI28_12475, partial [Pseudomonadota bacterium]